MAETLRRLDDLTESEVAGPMFGFLAELQSEGRAETIHLAGTTEPDRWISTEERELYRSGKFLDGDDTAETLDEIGRRYLQTHALVGIADLLARYPIEPAVATDLLESWSETGGAIRLDAIDGDSGPRWADPENLADARRLSIAIRRRETVAVAPEVFADFLLRRHHVHPEARREGCAAVEGVLEQLAGFSRRSADNVGSDILLRAFVIIDRPGSMKLLPVGAGSGARRRMDAATQRSRFLTASFRWESARTGNSRRSPSQPSACSISLCKVARPLPRT